MVEKMNEMPSFLEDKISQIPTLQVLINIGHRLPTIEITLRRRGAWIK